MLRINETFLEGFISSAELEGMAVQVESLDRELRSKTCPGSEFLGWLDWPERVDPELIREISDLAKQLRTRAEVLVTIGIGGSYLGAKACYEALAPQKEGIELVFAGQNISGRYLTELLDYLRDKDFCLNVISKSGTTTEPAIAFRLLRQLIVEKYGQEALAERIVATTDASRGALRQFAEQYHLKTFTIPDDIGGRYSVLTAVGLLPLAVAGIDIETLIQGAHRAQLNLESPKLSENLAYRYAVIRNCLQRKGFLAEALVSFEPELCYFAEWWKQLFGESEGKDGKGLLPCSMHFTTDLHSLGQFVQDGRRIVFETCLVIDQEENSLRLPDLKDNSDGLDYLLGKTIDEVNAVARQATFMAHHAGGVPIVEICLERCDAAHLGYLIYFFELACAMSARLLGVNPFDQEGVEAYKVNMFRLLGKPGYRVEEQS